MAKAKEFTPKPKPTRYRLDLNAEEAGALYSLLWHVVEHNGSDPVFGEIARGVQWTFPYGAYEISGGVSIDNLVVVVKE